MRRDGNRSAEKLKSEIAGAERIRGRRSEVRGRRSEVGGRRSEVRGRIERKRRLRSSSKKFVELVVRTDPCPLDGITPPFSDDTNVPTYSYRPIIRVTAELFELKRIVSGIFQK